ncbi:MAG: mismatch-specific DNA-glycosylase [Dehalococcoidia bacterium]|nr:mismatch-specific DNA-glycosylase [Dehalococcoidia bacterium]
MPPRPAQATRQAPRRARSARQVLPDYLRPGLDVVFVGINPGRHSAARGHHYAGPGNHFWPLLYEAGFVPESVTCEDDGRMPDLGIGLTNIVDRPSRGIDDLSRAEMEDGAVRLREKLRRYRPRVVCFNGKAIYQVFAGHACELGLQPERLPAASPGAEGALAYVMPSTSPRTASYQRADKLRFFRELKAVVDRAVALRQAQDAAEARS